MYSNYIDILLVVSLILLFLAYKYTISIRHNIELKKSVKSFEMLMESMMEGIIIFDSEGICLHTNRVADILFGYQPKEMIGKHASEIVCIESREIIRKKMQNYNQKPYEAMMLRKDETKFPAILRGRNIFWNDKRVRISTIIDISDVKQLQYDLEVLNKNLEEKVVKQIEDIRQKDQMLQHQNKLASMGEMIGAIAHQWRQPLNALNINIENLDDDFEDGLIDGVFIDNFIIKNRSLIQFMSDTIDDFRNFYRIDKTKEFFSIKKAIKITTEIEKAHLKNHAIEICILGDDVCILGYKSEFEHVILNLINNAADVINHRGILYGKIEIILSTNSITIKDNAGGIDEAIKDRIFEPYFTTKEQGEGTGIGLYMSKVIIEKNMGGNLCVQNGSKGAEFTIIFPDTLEKSIDMVEEVQMC